MLAKILGRVAIAASVFPSMAFGQSGVGERCMREVLDTHVRDQKALKAPPPQGPIMESQCRAEKKIVSCSYYDNRATPNITFELRSTHARVIACFEQAGKQTRKTDDAMHFELPMESCIVNFTQKSFDGWYFGASCGPKLPF